MRSDRYTLVFRGVRGSIPSPGASTVRYGGETACLTVDLGAGRWLVLDCGTGLRQFSRSLEGGAPPGEREFHVLLSHYHWDHIQGISFFRPIEDPRATFVFYGWPWQEMGVREVLEGAIRPPWFPFSLSETMSRKLYVNLGGDPVEIAGLTVRTTRAHHPQGVTAFRVEHPGGSFVFATDSALEIPSSCDSMIDFAAETDLLIADAHHTREEMGGREAHGHATWEQACNLALRARVRRLVLFHHDPDRTDDDVDAIVEQAAAIFPAVSAAREGTSLDV